MLVINPHFQKFFMSHVACFWTISLGPETHTMTLYS